MENNKKAEVSKFLLAPLIVFMLTQIGTTGDNSVLSIATKELIVKLNANLADVQIANLVYSLCAGAFMIVGGMTGIIIGWKKNYRLGLGLLTIGELIVSISPNILIFTWVGRTLVGLGASFAIPSVLGMIAGLYKGKDLVLAFGGIGAASGIAAIVAPIVAGLLIDLFGYKFAFIFLAIYFLIILIATVVIPDIEKSSKKLPFDLGGTILACIGLFLFIIGLSKITTWGLITPIAAPFTILGISPAIPMIILGIIFMIILVYYEKKLEEKRELVLLPKSFLTTPQVRNGLYACATAFFTLGGFIILINPYLQLVAKFNAIQTGYISAGLGIPMVLFALLLPKYYPSLSSKTALRIGYILLAISTIPLSLSLKDDGINILLIIIGLIIFGIGQGIISPHASAVVAKAVNPRDAQQSSGIQATSRNVGQAIGVAILGLVMLFTLSPNFHLRVNENQNITQETKEKIKDIKISFTSNEILEKQLGDINENDKNELIKINAISRKRSVRIGLYTMGIISVLMVLGTNGIKDKKKDE